jgi:Flp pilus assembly protein TadG
MIPTISQSGLLGVQRGLQQATDAANKIASSVQDIDTADLATNLVDLKLGEQQVEASAIVLKVDDQIKGSILDIKT